MLKKAYDEGFRAALMKLAAGMPQGFQHAIEQAAASVGAGARAGAQRAGQLTHSGEELVHGSQLLDTLGHGAHHWQYGGGGGIVTPERSLTHLGQRPEGLILPSALASAQPQGLAQIRDLGDTNLGAIKTVKEMPQLSLKGEHVTPADIAAAQAQYRTDPREILRLLSDPARAGEGWSRALG